MVFPTSKLPSAAQPWGRFVEKSITNVETLVSTERVNNAARDAQNSLNIKRLDQSVTAVAAATVAAQQAADDAQAAIDGLTSLGSIDSDYTINAGNINAGTLTGVTVQTASSGTRVLMEGDDVRFFDADNQLSGIIAASGNIVVGASVSMSAGVTTRNITINDTTVTLNSPNAKVSVSSNDNMVQLYSTMGTQVTGPFYASSTSQFIGTVQMNSSLTTNGGAMINGNLETGGALTRTVLATGVSTTCTINGSGQFVRTTSSARYKQDIQPISVPLSTVLQMEPRKFRLIEEVEANPDARYYGGFIAEELDALGLDTFVGYEKLEDGTVRPESVYYAELTAALVSAIKELNARIETLEGK